MSAAMKDDVRRRIHADRAQRSPQDRAAAAEAIALHAAAMMPLATAERVACYQSFPSEPGTGPLIAHLQDRGVEVLVPITMPDGRLDWTVAGPRGDGPLGDGLGPEALATVDLAFVPALAVDHRGVRLGRGGGYYDRALPQCRAPSCALVFADEILESLPCEPHDQPVDLVLTEAGIFRPLKD